MIRCLAGLLALAAGAAAGCPLPGAPLQDGDVQLGWRVDGPTITVGRHFALQVQLCPATATLSRVDATMPEHRHGMNYRPSLKPLGDGRWRVDGLMFHMAGRWELHFDVAAGAATRTLRESVVLP